MRKSIAAILMILFAFQTSALCGLGKRATMYVGGTVTSIPEKTEGVSSTASESEFIFQYKGGKLAIPYNKIETLEYGQHAGRRVGLAIVVAWPLLFSKKRRHYLTVGFLDSEGKKQAAVFELGKEVTRTTLASLEARTGKKVEYEDEEARKAGNK